MRIGVIGAGAMGGTLAALLDRAGHEVEVVARGANLDAIRDGGIRLDGAWGEHTASVSASEALTAAPEFAIAATKAQNADAALAANAPALTGVPLLVVQNGLDGVEAARRAVPTARATGALATIAASYLSPGRVTVTAAGALAIGGGDPATTRLAADLLGPVLEVHAVDDFAGAQWSKLLINQVNALPGITGLSAQEVIADPGLRRILTAAMRETARTGFASGVRFANLQGLGQPVAQLLAHAPLALSQAVPRLIAKRMGAIPNPGSTLQSIRRGQPSEVDHLNGAVVRAAERLGRPAPLNAAMVELVHEVERTSAFLAPAEVVRRVPVR